MDPATSLLTAPLRHLRRRLAIRRLWRAEQRFFDAYGRGGPLAGQDLVVPLGLFARAPVWRMLVDWLALDAPLDVALLEETWWEMDGGDRGDVRTFHRNLAEFLALVANPDGRPGPERAEGLRTLYGSGHAQTSDDDGGTKGAGEDRTSA